MDGLKGSRRSVLRGGMGVGLSLAAGSPLGAAPAEAAKTTLTPAETLTLRALMARLVPADAHGGGAVEAGADVYLDRMLGSDYAQALPTYRAAFAALDRHANGQRFATLDGPAMDALIGDMEAGKLQDSAFPDGGTKFFGLLRRHTLEGFLCDPMYGGNRNFIGWKTIGFHGVQLYYTEEDQALNGPDARPPRSLADFGGNPV